MALLRGRLHWAILLSVLLGGGLGYLGYISVVPMYRSTGSVVIERNTLLYRTDDPTSKDRWFSFVVRQQQLLRSREVAERALASDTWQSRGADAVAWDAEDFSKAIETDIDESNNTKNIFEISFDAPDGLTAGLGNRALLDAYSEEFDYRAENEYRKTIMQLQSQVQKSEINIKQYLAQRRTVVTDYEFNQMEAEIRALTNQRIELRENLDIVRAGLNSRNPVQDGMSTNPADLIAATPCSPRCRSKSTPLKTRSKPSNSTAKAPATSKSDASSPNATSSTPTCKPASSNCSATTPP